MKSTSISPTPHPLMGTSPKGVAMAELSPGLPVLALTLSAFQTSPARFLSLQFSYTLLIHFTGGLPLTPLPSIVLSSTYPLCKVTFIHSHHMPIPSQCANFTHLITLQSTPTAASLTKLPIYVLISINQ